MSATSDSRRPDLGPPCGVACHAGRLRRYRPSMTQFEAIFAALRSAAEPEIRAAWVRDTGMVVFQMYGDRSRVTVDIFVEHPIPFDALWADAVLVELPTAACASRRSSTSCE